MYMSSRLGSRISVHRLGIQLSPPAPSFRFSCKPQTPRPVARFCSGIVRGPRRESSDRKPGSTLTQFSTARETMPGLSFSDDVVGVMQRLFPEALADRAWDNTGHLIKVPTNSSTESRPSVVLLTNDVTAAVVDEALAEGAQIIISYHPVIFRGLKSISMDDPMQANLLRLIAAGVSVYCPHTALDAAIGGMNDWLVNLVSGEHPVQSTVLQPISRPLPAEQEGAGYGRQVKFSTRVGLHEILKRLSLELGLQHMSVALPPRMKGVVSDEQVFTAAVCAGSGSSVLKDSTASILVTGEMSHHDALRFTQQGQIVVTVFHSNSERKYLEKVLQPKLANAIRSLEGRGQAQVLVSKADHDPFQIVDVNKLPDAENDMDD